MSDNNPLTTIESFLVGKTRGHVLIKTGIAEPEIDCTPTFARIAKPGYNSDGMLDGYWFTYSKNGGPKQTFHSLYDAETESEDYIPQLIAKSSQFHNEMGSGIAFVIINEDDSDSYLITGIGTKGALPAGVGGGTAIGKTYSYDILKPVSGSNHYPPAEGPPTEFTISRGDVGPVVKPTPEATSIVFYPTEGMEDWQDGFYLFEDSESSESIEIMGCGTLAFPPFRVNCTNAKQCVSLGLSNPDYNYHGGYYAVEVNGEVFNADHSVDIFNGDISVGGYTFTSYSGSGSAEMCVKDHVNGEPVRVKLIPSPNPNQNNIQGIWSYDEFPAISYTGANDEVSFCLQPVKIEPPPEGYADGGDGTSFVTSNYTSESELPIDIELNGAWGNWALKDTVTGEVLADNNGSNNEDVYINYYDGTRIELRRPNTPSTNRYLLTGEIHHVKFLFGSGGGGGEAASRMMFSGSGEVEEWQPTVEGSLEVLELGREVDRYSYNVNQVELTVPDKLTLNITNADKMFEDSNLFNQDISGWNTGVIESMHGMFSNCQAFNQPIGVWDTSQVYDMSSMFSNCVNFNQPLNDWNLSNCEDIGEMFYNCASFNQSLRDWDTSSISNMSQTFAGCESFNGSLYNWDTSYVNSMWQTFQYASSFNQPIGHWDVSEVEDMDQMFQGCTNFNQPIGNWDVSLVEYMDEMFQGCTNFNRDIGLWQVISVVTMDDMFYGAESFNQDLSQWCVKKIRSAPSYFDEEAYNWVLPRPKWGTCPGEPEVEAFEFTVTSDDTNRGSETFSVSMTNPQNPWVLEADGAVIASNEWVSGEVVKSTSWGGVIILTHSGLRNRVVQYKVKAVAEVVVLSSGYAHGSGVARTVDVTKFSSTIVSHQMSLGSVNLTVPNTLPAHVKSMNRMFAGCDLFNQDITGWDVSNVTNMREAFLYASEFHQPIGSWDVSNVTTFEMMFQGCTDFNQDLSAWRTLSALDFSDMFSNCAAFNQNLDSWSVGTVTSTRRMFDGALSFNQPLLSWDMSSVTKANGMFSGCVAFDQSLNAWDTSSFVDVYDMFYNCTAYDQPMSNWNTSNVTSASSMFKGCTNFNRDISMWDMRLVWYIQSMFDGCTYFNQPIGKWVFTRLQSIEATFQNAINFNQDISKWNMSTVKDIKNAFNGATAFNQDISAWNTMNVEYVNGAFINAINFNQDLSWWCLPKVRNAPYSDWDEGARLWGLPRPSWGSCVRGENTDVPYVPTVQDTSGFVWTQSNRVSNMTLEVHLEIYGLVGDWSLHSGRFEIVSNLKENRDYYVTKDDANKLIRVRIGYGQLRTFRFKGNCEWLRVHLNNTYKPRDEASMVFIVHQWSSTIGHYKLNLPETDLRLPSTPPPKLTSMSGMFEGANRFNQDISAWDVSNVTSMRAAFRNNKAFNANISGWVTTKVKSMINMFQGASSFNQDLSQWCATAHNIQPSGFRTGAVAWVQPKPVWGSNPATGKLPEVVNRNSEVFVIDLNIEHARYSGMWVKIDIDNVLPGWKVVDAETGVVLCKPGTSDNVVDVDKTVAKSAYWLKSAGGYMNRMQVEFFVKSFEPKRYEIHATGTKLQVHNSQQLFEPHVTCGAITVKEWSTNITQYVFRTANMDLLVPEYLPPQVTSMAEMFQQINRFSQDLSMWNTSNVTNMNKCFYLNYEFNADISGWNVGNVTNMEDFMSCYDQWTSGNSGIFNQDLSKWNVGKVTNMTRMFSRQEYFIQDLSKWCVGDVLTKPADFVGKAFPAEKLPVWGSCPRGENGRPTVESTVFTVDNTLVAGVPIPVKLAFSGAKGDSLKVTKDGVPIADATGSLSPELVMTYTAWDRFEATLTVPAGLRAVYAMDAGAPATTTIDCTTLTKTSHLANITIDQFSKTAVSYYIHAGVLELDVPKTLPSAVVHAREMFYGCKKFNTDISGWDMRGVESIQNMFTGCETFNADLSRWKIPKCLELSGTFNGCTVFNADISGWKVGNINGMSDTFKNAKAFNQDLSSWNVLNIKSKPYEFDTGATAWTLPKPVWGTDPLNVPAPADEFLPPMRWNTVNVARTDIELPLEITVGGYDSTWRLYRNGVLVADSNLFLSPTVIRSSRSQGAWYLELYAKGSNVNSYELYMENMQEVQLGHASSFSKPKDGIFHLTSFGSGVVNRRFPVNNCEYTVPKVLPRYIRSLSGMFASCRGFNQDIGNWDTSNITDMSYLFKNTRTFNQDITDWDTSKVANMNEMFEEAIAFNQDLSKWNVLKIPTLPSKFNQNAPQWLLPKPVWGTTGAPRVPRPAPMPQPVLVEGKWTLRDRSQVAEVIKMNAVKLVGSDLSVAMIAVTPPNELLVQAFVNAGGGDADMTALVTGVLSNLVGEVVTVWALDAPGSQITYTLDSTGVGGNVLPLIDLAAHVKLLATGKNSDCMAALMEVAIAMFDGGLLDAELEAAVDSQ